MQKFEYQVKDKQGEFKKGIVEARDEKQAARVLQEKGFWIVSIRAKKEGLSSGVKKSFFRRVTSGDKVNFTRQFSTMISAGLPITEALSILEVQANPAMAQVVSEILREVEGGGSLTSALEKKPEIFDNVYVALVRAGEAAGVLDKILSRLADNLEKQREFQGKIKSAMIYPIIVIIGMLAVMAIMVIFVIPQMKGIFDQFQAELPVTTKLLLKISDLAVNYWPLAIIGLAGLILGSKIASQKPQFKDYLDHLLFKLPIIAKLRRQIVLTEFTRTLGLLTGAGVLLVEAMNIVYHSLGSSIYAKAVKNAATEVEKGLPLATALAKAEVFPPLLPQMIAVGEETGKIDEVLSKISTYFEQEADRAVKNLTTALEPLIMVVLGVGVAFLIVSIIMPIYDLTGQF